MHSRLAYPYSTLLSRFCLHFRKTCLQSLVKYLISKIEANASMINSKVDGYICSLVYLPRVLTSPAFQKIEKPLASLISDICIAPTLITLLLETNVGEPWIPAISELEKHLDVLSVRGRVKAVKDMTELASELKLVVCIYSF
jgi:hypothetical protein